MKALILNGPNEPFEMAEVPDPVPAPGEAVARVFACGCGLTIQHVKAGRLPVEFPRIIGHEIAGEIVAVGAGVTSVAKGDGVTAYGYLNCGYCRPCLSNLEPLCENITGLGIVGMTCDGGYAEYIRLPAHNFIKFPDGIDYKRYPAEMGVVTDALATPYKVLNRARVKPGETVAVVGAGGGVGIHQIMMAKWAQARPIAIDVTPSKLEACRRAGAEAVIDASSIDVVEAVLEITRGNGVDVVIDYVSTTLTLETSARVLARRGRLVALGGAGKSFQVSSSDLLYKELDLLGSRYVTRRELLETFDLIVRREIWPLVSDIRPLAEAEALHQRVERGEVIGRAAVLIN